jgi:hypothetical protein
MRHRLLTFALIAAASACSRGATPPDSANEQLVTATGPLRLEADDYATSAGILFALPQVTTASGTIGVSSTRYGSLCRFALAGDAQVSGRTVVLRVRFNERLTLCTGEIRALRYNATITVSPGTYDVSVIHQENNEQNTLVVRTVTVP